MLLIAGALTNISRDLYEASEVDGATKWQQFKEITLPMVLHQVAPTLVMTFAYNFNNFGAIYLLTEGGPTNPEYRFAGHTDSFLLRGGFINCHIEFPAISYSFCNLHHNIYLLIGYSNMAIQTDEII